MVILLSFKAPIHIISTSDIHNSIGQLSNRYTMTLLSPDNKQHKKRVSKACDCCRKSKTKCDGMRPCTRCLQDNKICTYNSNKKKADRLYPSSYVDLLETRVSILVQSLNKLLEKSKSDEELAEFMNDPAIYNENREFDINKVICELLSNEKLQNLSKSNINYSIDEITNVTSTSSSNANSNSNSTSATTPTSSSPSISTTPLNISIPNRQHRDSHIHKPHHTNSSSSITKSLRSPISSTSLAADFNSNNLDSLLYEPNNLDLNTSDDTHSTNSSLMSPVYSINDQSSAGLLDNWQGVKQEYGFNWDVFEFGKSATAGNTENLDSTGRMNGDQLVGNTTFGFPEF